MEKLFYKFVTFLPWSIGFQLQKMYEYDTKDYWLGVLVYSPLRIIDNKIIDPIHCFAYDRGWTTTVPASRVSLDDIDV